MKTNHTNSIGLPEPIKTYIKSKFSAFWIENYSLKSTSNHQSIFEVQLERAKMKANLFFNQDGKLLDYKLTHL